jgi:kynurenine formamidase
LDLTVARIIDLTYPIADHFRWKVQRELAASFERNDDFQVTRIGFPVHGFTHIDAPRHMLPEAPTTSDFRLQSLVGEAAIIDVSGLGEDTAISAESLAAAGAHVRTGDMIIVKTAWDERFSLGAAEFWTRAPYLTREACEWLAHSEPVIVGFDFPQDRPIRALLDGGRPTMAEFVSHDVILRRGIPLIEYLCNLGAVGSARTEIYALPLKILEADGAPARVIAIER